MVPFESRYKRFDDLLYHLATPRARRVKLVQLARAGKTGDHVTGAPVDDVAVARPHPAQLAGLQYGLWMIFGLHVQGVLAVALRALL